MAAAAINAAHAAIKDGLVDPYINAKIELFQVWGSMAAIAVLNTLRGFGELKEWY